MLTKTVSAKTALQKTTLILNLCLLAYFTTFSAFASSSRDWPRRNGPNLDLTSSGDGIFRRPAFGLQKAWERDLGSGYSGIVVVEDRLITGFSKGDDDYLAALRTSDGSEIWRYRISEIYKGHDGSDDGPLATPSVDDGKVFGLGAWGHLFALRQEDGREIWAHKIDEGFGARAPEYGFTTSPTVIDGVLVVQTGGDRGRAVSGFDPQTGELLWSAEDATVGYQSPLGIELGGKPHVFAATNEFLLGLKPHTGEVLFKHPHRDEPEDGFAQPIPIGDHQVLVTEMPGASLYQIEQKETGYALREIWQSRRLRGTYAIPVPHEGYLYGYAGGFLTCVDQSTGETVWKSRPPGAGYLVLVDGHLVIQTDSGEIVVAEATPEGYREKARAKALERGYYNTPTYAAGRFYVRNLTQVASVAVTDAPNPTVAAPPVSAAKPLGRMATWVSSVEAAQDKKRRLDELMAAQKSFPILEGDRLVHFVYRGETPDLALTGNMLPSGDRVMARIEGTAFYYLSLELAPASHYTYGFAIFDERIGDPLNPRKAADLAGELSGFSTPGYERPSHLEEPRGPRGTIHSYTWKSEIHPGERETRIYLPPGYERSDRRYPLFVVNYGDQLLELGGLHQSLDNLIHRGEVEPLIAVLIPRLRYQEYAGAQLPQYTSALVEELIGHIDASYRTIRSPEGRGITGVASGATHALYAAMSRPDVFGGAALQSFYYGDVAEEFKAFITERKHRDLRLYVAISQYDYAQAEEVSRELVALLEENGYQPKVQEVGDGVGWTSWGSRMDRALKTLFPKK